MKAFSVGGATGVVAAANAAEALFFMRLPASSTRRAYIQRTWANVYVLADPATNPLEVAIALHHVTGATADPTATSVHTSIKATHREPLHARAELQFATSVFGSGDICVADVAGFTFTGSAATQPLKHRGGLAPDAGERATGAQQLNIYAEWSNPQAMLEHIDWKRGCIPLLESEAIAWVLPIAIADSMTLRASFGVQWGEE